MYDEYLDELLEEAYLDELLEEAYLEGYYDYYESGMNGGRRKKLRARHKAKTNHITQRALDNIGFVQTGIDADGNKIGYSKMGDGPKIKTKIKNRREDLQPLGILNNDSFFDPETSTITLSKKHLKIPGSDVVAAHEYGHAYDAMKSKDKKTPTISNKLTKDIKNTAKHVGFKPKFLNEHDSLPSEMYADAFAVKNTKGQNNANRFRKALNELRRRDSNTLAYNTIAMYADKMNSTNDPIMKKRYYEQAKKWYKRLCTTGNHAWKYVRNENLQRSNIANQMANENFVKKIKRK